MRHVLVSKLTTNMFSLTIRRKNSLMIIVYKTEGDPKTLKLCENASIS